MQENKDLALLNAGSSLIESKEILESANIIKDEITFKNDPYAYLDRNGFTSEKFKIEIRNLPRYYGIKELKKLLNEKLKLNSTKIKVPSQRRSWVYVCFRSEEEKINALNVLNKYKWKGFGLRAEEAKPVPDPLVQKRILNLNKIKPEQPHKKIKLDERELSVKIKDATTPLWKIPYIKQLEIKTQIISEILKEFGSRLTKTNTKISSWWKSQKKIHNGLPCEVHPIKYSNTIDGYRNKCEFSVGINEETGKKTVGFRLGSYAQGSTNIAPVDGVPNVPEQMRIAVNAFQNFIQNSEYDVFNSETHEGYWRQLTARYGFKTEALMLVIGLHPQKMKVNELNEIKNQIKEYFMNGDGKYCKVTSLYLQQITNKKSEEDEPVYEHVFGETYITEQLLGKTFRISPQAFFQVNTNAAEILYESIAELAELSENVTLLDVCCGTGSIGICLSEKCGEVLGLEKSSEAINDAKANAAFNKVNNAEFYTGKAEEILGCVARKAKTQEIVAIVDPPRPGLQQDALLQIRKNETIKKLIYVACEPKRALQNFIDLGRAPSKIYKGEPFLPVKAIPIDLFPHTKHCELLVYFKRQ